MPHVLQILLQIFVASCRANLSPAAFLQIGLIASKQLWKSNSRSWADCCNAILYYKYARLSKTPRQVLNRRATYTILHQGLWYLSYSSALYNWYRTLTLMCAGIAWGAQDIGAGWHSRESHCIEQQCLCWLARVFSRAFEGKECERIHPRPWQRIYGARQIFSFWILRSNWPGTFICTSFSSHISDVQQHTGLHRQDFKRDHRWCRPSEYTINSQPHKLCMFIWVLSVDNLSSKAVRLPYNLSPHLVL